MKRSHLRLAVIVTLIASVAHALAQGAKPIAWKDLPLAASRGSDKNGQRTTFSCPPGGDPRTFDSRIYGTDTYTDATQVFAQRPHRI